MKIVSKKKLSGGDVEKFDTLKKDFYRNRNITDILLEAQQCWNSLDDFRKKRERCKRYAYGDQWGDKIQNAKGETITEEQYIKDQGNVPLKNNLIRRLIKTVIGQYRNNQTEPVCIARDRDEQSLGEMMSTAVQYNCQLNHISELDGRSMEEFLLSGTVFQKETFAWRKEKMDVWTDIVSPNRIFFDSHMQDARHWDCNLIGELHDLSFPELCSVFSRSIEDTEKLKNIYSYSNNETITHYYQQLTDYRLLRRTDFLIPDTPGLCRVIEIWRKEQKERLRCHDILKGEYYKDETSNITNIELENRRRIEEAALAGIPEEEVPLIEYEWFVDSYWYFRFCSPFGDVLQEGETPYWHGEHPYTFKIYPFIDSEAHSFVEDIIDQQRYINRLITMIDFIMRSSSKGVLMVPEESIPDGTSIEDIAEQWVKYNGVITFRAKPGIPMPQQISTNATNIGAHELLSLQMNLMEEITGVHGAMQGKDAKSGTASSLYRQQAENASINLIDLFESFKAFREERDTKKMKMIQQFYTERRYMNIVGSDASKLRVYDPNKVANIEFDLTITESANTPAYRMIANEFLMQIFQTGQITIEQLLENGSFPFADKLLQQIQTAKEQTMIQQQAMPQNNIQDIQQ